MIESGKKRIPPKFKGTSSLKSIDRSIFFKPP